MSILDDPVARWSALELQAEVQRLEAQVALEEARAAAMKRLYLAALARVEQVHRGLDVLQRRCRWLLWRCRGERAREAAVSRAHVDLMEHCWTVAEELADRRLDELRLLDREEVVVCPHCKRVWDDPHLPGCSIGDLLEDR